MSTAFKDFYECEAKADGIGIGWRPRIDGQDLVGQLAMIKTVVSRVWQQSQTLGIRDLRPGSKQVNQLIASLHSIRQLSNQLLS